MSPVESEAVIQAYSECYSYLVTTLKLSPAEQQTWFDEAGTMVRQSFSVEFAYSENVKFPAKISYVNSIHKYYNNMPHVYLSHIRVYKHCFSTCDS